VIAVTGRAQHLKIALGSVAARARGRRTAHFLHIGKNAGTAIKRALREGPEPARYRVALHTHGVRMRDLPRGDKFFFVVRDPVDRFVSAFYSRQRQGAPRFHQPWTEGEARAFARFAEPEAVGLALAGGGAERAAAVDALRSIEHLRSSYWDWFESADQLRRRQHDILWIGFAEALDSQLDALAAQLGLAAITLPRDDTSAHRRATGPETALPDAARDALREWYAADYDFVRLCREIAPRA
jgi:hypothetical protein